MAEKRKASAQSVKALTFDGVSDNGSGRLIKQEASDGL
jgi:hypothetical protein